jgi:hypothetical protein
MTSEQGYVFVTRGLSIFCLISAFIALCFLSPDIFDAAHYWHLAHVEDVQSRLIASDIYLFRVYLLRSAGLVLQAAVLLCAAGWFYRGNKKLRGFFGME